MPQPEMSTPGTPTEPFRPVPGAVPDALDAAVVASTDDAVIVTSTDGTIVAWNPGATRLYGYEPADVLGRPLVTLAPPADAVETTETIGLLAQGARPEVFDARRVHRDARILDVSVSASPIREGDGEPYAIAWIERDVTGRRYVERMISHLAFHDPLTGLANRTLLDDRLRTSLERTRRGGGVVAVVYLDLDDFKVINDRFGHAAGDQLLQLVGARLENLLRPEDTLARVGGDEFVVVSDRVPSARAAVAIAERLATALGAPFDFEGTRVVVTASFGVAAGDYEAEPDRVLAAADRAMYRAKAAGGASVEAAVAVG